jgi:hypothetical protein
MRRRASIDELVAADRLERIAPDAREARDLLAHAEAHLESARAIEGSDPAGAYQLLYDAARKAAAADMAAAGLRVKGDKPGAHAAVVLYAEEALTGIADAAALASLDQMRRSRNRSEYGGMTVSAHQLQTDLDHAVAIVAAVRGRI